MRKLMTAALALAGLSSSALADDTSVEALVGLTFPVTVAPAGNTPEYAEQVFSVQFAPNGEMLVTPPSGNPVNSGPPSTYSVETVDDSGGSVTSYQLTLNLSLIYIKDVQEPTGSVPTPTPYSSSADCRFDMQIETRQFSYVYCAFAYLQDGGRVVFGND